MPGVEAVVFDLDGTLFDHDGAVIDALRAWWPDLDDAHRHRAERAWFAAEHRHVARWLSREITWTEQRRERLREVLPVLGRAVEGERELDGIFDEYLVRYQAAWRGFDDLGALARLSVQGLRLAVLTNGNEEQQRAKLAALGLAERFELVLTAEALGAAKPCALVFREACRRLGLAPGSVLHVGDVIDTDVRAPIGAGLRAVLLDRTSRVHEAPAVRSLTELPAYVTGLNHRIDSTQ